MAGRIRSIKPELLEDEKAAALSDAAWRLFVSSWLLADDYGCFRAGPRYLAALVWQDTHRDALTPLLELADAGRLFLYESEGQPYAWIPTWTRHQRVDNAGKRRVPAPPTNIRELSASFAATLRESRRPSASRGDLLSDPKTSPLDLRSPTTIPIYDTEQRNVGFENPPPSGAGLSPVLEFDPEPLADDPAPAASVGDLAPVAPTPETPVPVAWQAVETTFDPTDDPIPVPEEPPPSVGQPEPPACPPAEEPATTTVFAPVSGPPTVPFAPSDPGQAALPLALAPVIARHDPAEAIFAEYVAAWRRVLRGRRAPTLDAKRRKLTLARLREFSEDDLKSAARGIFASEWHIGEKQTAYDLVMRDAAHVERFMQCDEDARRKADVAERAKNGVPEWLSGATRPSSRVVSALRLRGTEPIANNGAPIDFDAMISDLGSVEVT